MTATTIGAVIAVYNGAETIREAVDSVLSQTRPADEVLVVDDGSTDGTPGILASYGGRLTAIRRDNGGVAAARNEGARRSESRYVAFLDADDRWRPEKLAVFEEESRAHPEAGLFFSDAVIIGPGGIPTRPLRHAPVRGSFWREMLLENRVTLSTAMVRRDVFDAAGGFHERFRCPAGVEDWDLFLRLSRRAAAVHVRRALTEYRLHPASAIQTRRFQLRDDALEALDRNAAGVDDFFRRRARAAVFYQSAVRHLAAGDGASARGELRECRPAPGYAARSLALWLSSFLPAPALAGLRAARAGLLRTESPLFVRGAEGPAGDHVYPAEAERS